MNNQLQTVNSQRHNFQNSLTLRNNWQIKVTESGSGYALIKNQPCTKEDIKAQFARLAMLFPKEPPSVYAFLAESIGRHALSYEQLRAATNRLIDTHKFDTFKPADFLTSIPADVQLMTFWQAYKWAGRIPAPSIVKIAQMQGESLWAKKSDLYRLGLLQDGEFAYYQDFRK